MMIRFLGVGGAFNPEFGSSAAVIPAGDDELLLVDCGSTTFHDLKRNKLLGNVTTAVITHMHDDHVGSLGSLIFYNYYVLKRRLTVACPPRLIPLIRTLLSLQITGESLETFVVIRELKAEDDIGNQKVRFIDTFGRHQPHMPTFGYIFTDSGSSVVYSGDIGDPDFLFAHMDDCDPAKTVVFHDVCFQRLSNQAHAFHTDIERHLVNWKIFGYHNNPLQAPEDLRIPLVFHEQFGELIPRGEKQA